MGSDGAEEEKHRDRDDHGEDSTSLPRADVLLIGGDLAYPRPTNENFEERFLRVFEDAMPPPLGHPTFDKEQPVYIQRRRKETSEGGCVIQ